MDVLYSIPVYSQVGCVGTEKYRAVSTVPIFSNVALHGASNTRHRGRENIMRVHIVFMAISKQCVSLNYCALLADWSASDIRSLAACVLRETRSRQAANRDTPHGETLHAVIRVCYLENFFSKC